MRELLTHLSQPDRLLAFLIYGFAFLLGSLPFGSWVAWMLDVPDLKPRESGDIGAAPNVSRVAGFWPAGVIMFLLDLGKGMLPVFMVGSPPFWNWVSSTLGGSSGLGHEGIVEWSPLAVWATGFAAVMGHCYSPWMHFKGGKGVSTSFGVILILSPLAALAGAVGFCFTFLGTRMSSLSSLSGLFLASVAYLVLNPIGIHAWMGAAILLVVLLRHEKNIDALLENREKIF